MDAYEQAIATMERIISGQEKAYARIWGDKSKVTNIVGTSNMTQNPEIAIVAPHHGDFEIDGYGISRRQCDQLDNLYFWRI